MDHFVLNRNLQRESLDQFNARLREYCRDNAVVGAHCGVAGESLVVSLLTADMTAAEDGAPCVVPQILLLEDTSDAKLEETVNLLSQGVAKAVEDEWHDAANPEEDPVPVATRLMPADVKGTMAWMVLEYMYGEVVAR
jgi:hypothetical protein